ncbi:MAG: PepSY domain-containing protein [Sphingomonas sp.]|uniref:PepSY domain-containing protein n=1 Tax=Sphingomonas sp. TaxID=28214 RepID=UPI001ACE66A2|nr:PepSY domain-containing protein [Sphingomonas sp.]MBN8806830.1 PepSY domain-containing protein [Sphingomonas sp.]
MSRIKRFATFTHLWFGLTVGLLGCFLAATGGWVLLRPQGDAIANTYLVSPTRCATPTSFDGILKTARGVHASPVDSLWWKADPAASLMVRYKDEQQAYFDRCDGHLLGLHSRWDGAFGFIEKLHRLRFLPTDIAGQVAATIAACMAVVMAGFGLFIWWPRRRSAWKPALRFDGSLDGRARTRNRHSVVGAFAAPMLLLIAATGVVIGFDSVQAFIMTVTGSKPLHKPRPAALPKGRPAAVDAAWRNVVALAGTLPRTATLKPPSAKQSAIEIYYNLPSDAHREIRNYAYAEAATGSIVQATPYARLSLGQRIYQWILGLHQGAVGGLFGQLLTLAAMLAILYLGYSGVRSYVQKRLGKRPPLLVRVAAIRDEAPGIKSFELTSVGRRLPRFAAGAHIDVHVPDGPKRQFSLTNGPRQRDRFTIAVRLEDESRGGSRGMHKLVPGQELRIGAPRNLFPIDRATRHATLIAAGIGITPILSMARHLAARRVPFVIHYFGRDAEGMAFRDALAEPPLAGHVQTHVGLGRAAIPAALSAILANRPVGGHLYMCGPDGFMTAVDEVVQAAGWPARAIHREHFAAPLAASAGPREAIEVTLARSGRKLLVAADESILDALKAAGVASSSSCEQGTCGDCALRVCAGEVDHRDHFLTEAQRQRGDVMLPCVSRARGRALTLDR